AEDDQPETQHDRQEEQRDRRVEDHDRAGDDAEDSTDHDPRPVANFRVADPDEKLGHATHDPERAQERREQQQREADVAQQVESNYQRSDREQRHQGPEPTVLLRDSPGEDELVDRGEDQLNGEDDRDDRQRRARPDDRDDAGQDREDPVSDNPPPG